MVNYRLIIKILLCLFSLSSTLILVTSLPTFDGAYVISWIILFARLTVCAGCWIGFRLYKVKKDDEI